MKPMGSGRRFARALRAVLALAGLVIATLGSGSIGLIASPAHADAPLPVVQAGSADALANSFGVCVHTGWLNTPYKDAAMVRDRLADLGVHHVRDDLTLDTPWQYSSMRTVASAGVKFDLILGAPGDAAPSAYVSTAASQLPGIVDSFEGPNEWDINGGTGWVGALRTRQAALYAAAKANPATAGLPVLAPAIAFPWNWSKAGDFGSMADLTNGHLYPGGRAPSYQLDSSISTLRSLVGGKPLVISETGYHNATASTLTNLTGHPMVPEDVSGSYLPRMLLENFSRGVQRTYDYELLDDFVDPTMANPEDHFGLLRNDLTPKPAYIAMKNLLQLVNDPAPAGGTAFKPGSLAFQVTGGGNDLRQLLVQRRDGHFELFLWRDVSIWDTTTRTRTAVTPTAVNLQLATPAEVGVYRPTTQAAAVSTATAATNVGLSLDGQVTALDIAPDQLGTPMPTPATPTTVVVPRPSMVRAVGGNRSATVSWQPPADQTGLRGTLVTSSPGNVSVQVPLGVLSLSVGGLRNGTSYVFTVRSLGTTTTSVGVPAAPVLLASVPTAPTIRTISTRKHTLSVRWWSPNAQGRPVVAYQVLAGGRTVTVDAAHLAAALKLRSHMRVRVGVRARNALGWSAVRWSRVVGIR